MKKNNSANLLKRLTAFMLIMAVVFTLTGCGDLKSKRDAVAKNMYEKIENPGIGAIGGDWAVFDIKHSGIEVDDGYFDAYYDSVRAALKVGDGVLDAKNYTTYARVGRAVRAIGKDPTNIDGHNLIEKLDNYEKIVSQGIHAPMHALITANYCGYKLENEEKYKAMVIEELINEGDIGGDPAEADYLGMGLSALGAYKDEPEVRKAVEKVLERLGEMQKEDGGFGNCEATAQVILGLCSQNIDPTKNMLHKKSKKSCLDGLMEYEVGSAFCHDLGQGENEMATEQALMALNLYLSTFV
ncbi:MAG: hypothetical protein PUK21_00885 [Peptostreptococcaceae bacterium]|nr:hypothetical protein [Peptostreptococcaceae bacterium]MDY5739134.1 hypothetical protein [Anaerovoracaceae bacterium]